MFKTFLRTANENVRLKRELRSTRLREEARDHRIARKDAELEKTRTERDEALRAIDLLIECARDRTVAVELVADLHRIHNLEEAG